jgi:hypothetical protein
MSINLQFDVLTTLKDNNDLRRKFVEYAIKSNPNTMTSDGLFWYTYLQFPKNRELVLNYIYQNMNTRRNIEYLFFPFCGNCVNEASIFYNLLINGYTISNIILIDIDEKKDIIEIMVYFKHFIFINNYINKPSGNTEFDDNILHPQTKLEYFYYGDSKLFELINNIEDITSSYVFGLQPNLRKCYTQDEMSKKSFPLDSNGKFVDKLMLDVILFFNSILHKLQTISIVISEKIISIPYIETDQITCDNIIEKLSSQALFI